MRATFRLPVALSRQARAFAAARGIAYGQFIEESIRASIKESWTLSYVNFSNRLSSCATLKTVK